MAGKRKNVPAALHSELSEYSSLIRALQTTETLDVTAQITNPNTRKRTRERTETEAEYNTPSKKPRTKKSSTLTAARKRKPIRNTWTDWPLHAADVPKSEWGLDEEVQTLVASAHKRHEDAQQASNVRSASSHEESSLELDDDDNPYLNPVRSPFVPSTTNNLVHILSSIAAHVPPQNPNVQNRLKPLGWRDVLDIVIVGGVINPATVERVRQRMNALEILRDNSSSSKVPVDVSVSLRASESLASLEARHMDSLFHLAGP